jgi:rod shape determining protein RodA
MRRFHWPKLVDSVNYMGLRNMKTVFNTVWRYIKRTDLSLIFLALLATGYGFILVYSVTPNSGRTILIQVAGIAIGIISMIIVSKIDYHNIAKAWKYIAIGCILLLLLTLVIGKSRAGSSDKSWIWLGPVTIQPSEFVKVAFAVTFAKHYDMVKEDVSSPRNVILLTIHGLIPICILLLQKDIGMMLVFILMFIFMMFAANVKLIYFVVAGTITLISSPLIWEKVLGTTQKNRILSLFDPIKYAADAYQQTQGRITLGSGGLFGYGLFNDSITQGSASLLPEKQNDMIFAVAGQELGLIGCIAILIIFTMLLIRIILISRKSKDNLGAIICIGIFASFSVQMMVNIGAVLVIFPITGISLPFFSSGGSSIVSCFLAIGLVLSVYMNRSDLLFTGNKNK